jgi:glutathione-regulated potassium-efflux system ancillary protein KefG
MFHPYFGKSRVNQLWSDQLSNLPNITVRFMYQLYKDLQINIQAERETLISYDRIVFQHPFYWYAPPPLLKKWMDEVLTDSWLYEGHLQSKEWLNVISTGSDKLLNTDEDTYSSYIMGDKLTFFEEKSQKGGLSFLPSYCLYNAMHTSEDKIIESAADLVSYISQSVIDPFTPIDEIIEEIRFPEIEKEDINL